MRRATASGTLYKRDPVSPPLAKAAAPERPAAPRRPRTRVGRWLQNLRISRKLAVVIMVHLLHATILLVLTSYGLKALDASRAYVEGEGLWSKAQKDATLHLLLYADSGDPREYQAYQAEVNVTLGDKQARLQLESPHPDMEKVREGFLAGRLNAADIPDLAWLFRTFHWEPHLDRAIGIWAQADTKMLDLLQLAQDLHAERSAATPDLQHVAELRAHLYTLNAQLTVLEEEFSQTLGTAARFLSQVVVIGTIGLTILFVGGALLISATVARQVTRSLELVRGGAQRMAAGELGATIPLEGNDEVAGVARAFNDMSRQLAGAEKERFAAEANRRQLEQLRELDRFKTDFVNTAAHELRTPLMPLRTQVHVLLRDKKEPPSPRQRHGLEIMERNLKRLATLVEDLLLVARAQAGRLTMTMASMDLGKLVTDAVDSYQPTAQERGIRLTLAPLPACRVEGDAGRITQVMENLLSNAMKFTPRGGSVQVTLEERPDSARVDVADSGIGLAPEAVRRLFHPFVQVHDTTQITESGSGLGLYICRQIVQMHAGDMGAKSPGPGAGTTLWFTLPKKAPAAPVAPAPEAFADPVPPVGASAPNREVPQGDAPA